MKIDLTVIYRAEGDEGHEEEIADVLGQEFGHAVANARIYFARLGLHPEIAIRVEEGAMEERDGAA